MATLRSVEWYKAIILPSIKVLEPTPNPFGRTWFKVEDMGLDVRESVHQIVADIQANAWGVSVRLYGVKVVLLGPYSRL